MQSEILINIYLSYAHPCAGERFAARGLPICPALPYTSTDRPAPFDEADLGGRHPHPSPVSGERERRSRSCEDGGEADKDGEGEKNKERLARRLRRSRPDLPPPRLWVWQIDGNEIASARSALIGKQHPSTDSETATRYCEPALAVPGPYVPARPCTSARRTAYKEARRGRGDGQRRGEGGGGSLDAALHGRTWANMLAPAMIGVTWREARNWLGRSVCLPSTAPSLASASSRFRSEPSPPPPYPVPPFTPADPMPNQAGRHRSSQCVGSDPSRYRALDRSRPGGRASEGGETHAVDGGARAQCPPRPQAEDRRGLGPGGSHA
ncbi:hypothetical protein CDD83_1020 [Cordyceps sp. RAO-2017]|nr:hypothetical protein CDD83_1020 [Cordyceps sp. RAO-2017]